MRELTNGKRQHFELNTVGRSPSEIQRDLEQMGVKGFVVHMSPSRVTVLADRADYESNRLDGTHEFSNLKHDLERIGK